MTTIDWGFFTTEMGDLLLHAELYLPSSAWTNSSVSLSLSLSLLSRNFSFFGSMSCADGLADTRRNPRCEDRGVGQAVGAGRGGGPGGGKGGGQDAKGGNTESGVIWEWGWGGWRGGFFQGFQ